MAEAEDVVVDAARHATVFIRDTWRRHYARAPDAPVPLASLARRLDLLLSAACGTSLTIRIALPPARPTVLHRLFHPRAYPRHRQALPATNGDSLWLPAHLGTTNEAEASQLYRAMALQQARRAMRGHVQAIAREREIIAPLRLEADSVFDTSQCNVHQLRRQVITGFALEHSPGLSLLFESFAYKRGVPEEADFVFDARVLPNPHWEPELRPLTGRDPRVRDYLDAQPDVDAYARQVADFLDTWLPRLRNDTRAYVTVAFGCTGGKHRSVYLAERMAAHARGQGWNEVATYHREQD